MCGEREKSGHGGDPEDSSCALAPKTQCTVDLPAALVNRFVISVRVLLDINLTRESRGR